MTILPMKLIAITAPTFLPAESDRIASLLGGDFWRVHIRKPGASPGELRQLLETLPAWCLPRVVLHDCQELALEFAVGGIHLNRRQKTLLPALRGRGLTVSASCHSLEEVACRKSALDYLFLSPVFDSISKKGYRSQFTTVDLRAACSAGIIDSRVFALGGVTRERLPLLASLGFGGAAMLGAVFP